MTDLFSLSLLEARDALSKGDVSSAEPMTTPVSAALPMREDKVTDGEIPEKVLKNAPKAEEGFFVVPKSVE